ncbi:cytochrome P450 6B7-like [Zerene cesonia]|uniref:cytochrome P450 6B7-like n=1 Tax=Zerene cesonia TaxID=33412 RepID=UPI0018E4FC82|nr:cytochrome P450 6B7-like [Zerene cesonia]
MAYLIVSFFVVLLSLCYYLFTRKYSYWKKLNVPHLEPTTFFGNYKDYLTLKTYLPQVVSDVCKKFPNEPYVGAYFGTEPVLIVKDPEYLKLVMTKDFYYFNSREVKDYNDYEVITQNIFFINGDRILEKLLDEASTAPSTEARLMMSRFTIDCIGSCAFGLNTKCLSDSEYKNPFLQIGQKIFEMNSSQSYC